MKSNRQGEIALQPQGGLLQPKVTLQVFLEAWQCILEDTLLNFVFMDLDFILKSKSKKVKI